MYSRQRMVGSVALAVASLVGLSACSSSSGSSGSASTSSSSPTTGSGSSSAPASGSSSASSTPTSGSATSSGGAATGSAGTITIWADPTKVAAITAAAAAFQTQYGVTVDVVQKPADTFSTNFIQQAPTGNGPDIIEDAVNNIGNYADNGVIAPVTIPNPSDFEKIAISAVTYNGQTWGMPSFLENVELYRNTELVPGDAATTFDQVIANGTKLKQAGKVKFAVAVPPDQYHLYGLMGSYGIGAYKLNSDGTYDTKTLNLGGAGGAKWAEQLAAWGKSGVVNTSLTYSIGETAFENGQVPYFMTGPWALADFKSTVKFKYAIDPIPTAGGQPATPFVGGQAFLVSKYSKNALIANKFVADYLGTQAVQISLANAGDRAPALTSAFNQVTQTDPNIAQFGKLATQQGVPFANTTSFNALFTAMGDLETAILQGKATDPAGQWAALVTKYQALAK